MIISETEGFFSMHTSKFFLYRFVHYMLFLEDEFKLVVVHKFKESTFYRLFPYYLKTERRLESLGITMSAIATLMLPRLILFHVSFFQFRSTKILQVSFPFLLLDFSNFFFRFLHFFPNIYSSSYLLQLLVVLYFISLYFLHFALPLFLVLLLLPLFPLLLRLLLALFLL